MIENEIYQYFQQFDILMEFYKQVDGYPVKKQNGL